MTPEEMRVLYDYNAWANRRQLEAVGKVSTEEFLRPMGSSFGSLRDTLHIFMGRNRFGWIGFRGGRRRHCRICSSSRMWRG